MIKPIHDFNMSSFIARRETDTQKTADNIITFDIETTSVFYGANNRAEMFEFSKPAEYYKKLKKAALCYVWQISIDGVAYFGRELYEFADFIRRLREKAACEIIVWVHNLPFEYQFIRDLFEWDIVNAREVRKPYRARTVDGIEFRCTYALTNMSLEVLAKSFRTAHQKLIGDLDYNIMRTPHTPLTVGELEYCENDVLVLHDYVAQFPLPLYETPLTQTGFVRRAVKAAMGKRVCRVNASHNEIDADIFRAINRAYAGGYTHANAFFAGRVLHNLDGYDFTSSYPYTMLSEKFPCQNFLPQGEGVSFDVLNKPNADDYAYIFDITMFNYKCVTKNTYISANKAQYIQGGVFDNGRVLSAEVLRVVITDVDVWALKATGKWSDIRFNYTFVARKNYLPKSLWDFTLKLYVDKTALKGIEERYDEYLRSKQFVNSLYGMCVTNTIKPDVEYLDGEWFCPDVLPPDEMAKKLRHNKQRGFMNYAVGVWVTAYARKNLWRAIVALDDVCVYCDTDSIKCLSVPKVGEYVEWYNKSVSDKLRAAAEYYGAPDTDFSPKDIHGVPHPIGVFDYEGHYKDFKTLGAKKYAYDNHDGTGVHITVAGVPKSFGKTLKSIDDFRDGLVFYPTPKRAKYISHYDDAGAVLNFGGELWECGKGICLQPTSYTLDATAEYKQLWYIDIGK